MLKILPVLTKTFAFRSRQKIIVTLIPGKIYSFPLIRPRNNKILYIKLPFYIIMTKEIQKYKDYNNLGQTIILKKTSKYRYICQTLFQKSV